MKSANEPQADPKRPGSGIAIAPRWLIAAVSALAFASCYFQVFILPRVPLTPWGDPVLFLQNAMRMNKGQLTYRDFFEFVTPGIDVFYASLLRIWGARAWIPNLSMAVLAAAVALLLMLIARQILPGKFAVIPGLLFTAGVLPISLYATHHWFSTVAALGASLVLLNETSMLRATAAGVLCGLAASFTQTVGVTLFVAVIVIFLIERAPGQSTAVWKNLAALGAATIATFGVFNAYFLTRAGAWNFFYSTVVFPVRYFHTVGQNTLHIYANGFRTVQLSRVFAFGLVHALMPLVYVVAVLVLWKAALPAEEKRPVLVMTAIGLALFFSIAMGPSPLRLATVTPPALIVFTFLLHRYSKSRFVYYAAAGIPLILAIAIPLRVQLHPRWFLESPSGRIAFLDRARYDEFRWASLHTRPTQPFFGHEPMCYALGLWDPTALYLTTNTDFTRPEQVSSAIAAIESSRVPLMVLVPGVSGSETIEVGSADHMGPFRTYLHNNYRLAARFATGDEAWVRNQDFDFEPSVPPTIEAVKRP